MIVPAFSRMPRKMESDPVRFLKEFAFVYVGLAQTPIPVEYEDGKKSHVLDKIGVWLDIEYRQTRDPNDLVAVVKFLDCQELNCDVEDVDSNMPIEDLNFTGEDSIDLTVECWKDIIKMMVMKRVPEDIASCTSARCVVLSKLVPMCVSEPYPNFEYAWKSLVR